MRNITLAIAASALAVPVAVALPTTEAHAAVQYDRNGNYVGQTWRGRDGRYRCRRPDGTTGLIIGGAGGALIGREIAGRGDRDVGTILGAAAGALIGREVERGIARRRCR